jgi:hypothetical protein
LDCYNLQLQTTQPLLSCSSGTVGRLHYGNSETLSAIISSSAAITLTFNSFDTESDYDMITVSSCTTTLCSVVNVLLDDYSGSIIPSPVTSTTGIMLIQWQSDESVTESGWDAVFASVGECYHNLMRRKMCLDLKSGRSLKSNRKDSVHSSEFEFR